MLRDAGIPDAPGNARSLLAGAMGKDLGWLLAHPERCLNGPEWDLYSAWIEERARGKPLAYVTGRREFYGRDFLVSPAVLIPRPETELLVEQGLKIFAGSGVASGTAGEPPLLLADIGTGSGCIAVTLAVEVARARVVATDTSESALEVAARNAEILGVADRVRFCRVDLLPRGKERFDGIFSNPPYVATGDSRLAEDVRKYEPAAALFAGETGMEMYERIVPLAARRLKAGGWLLLELNYRAEQPVRRLLQASLWQNVQVFPDLQGIPRCVVGQLRRDER
ncbi:MAG: peptide chain release factor N(5)-glutamine methyltransferase [Acidobacteria bacterium]|nr:peptide chain release factor N(5)-glutamine methyltransferase [Acidobacteriota bacterium]